MSTKAQAIDLLNALRVDLADAERAFAQFKRDNDAIFVGHTQQYNRIRDLEDAIEAMEGAVYKLSKKGHTA